VGSEAFPKGKIPFPDFSVGAVQDFVSKGCIAQRRGSLYPGLSGVGIGTVSTAGVSEDRHHARWSSLLATRRRTMRPYSGSLCSELPTRRAAAAGPPCVLLSGSRLFGIACELSPCVCRASTGVPRQPDRPAVGLLPAVGSAAQQGAPPPARQAPAAGHAAKRAPQPTPGQSAARRAPPASCGASQGRECPANCAGSQPPARRHGCTARPPAGHARPPDSTRPALHPTAARRRC
jgi:hypothetical protein